MNGRNPYQQGGWPDQQSYSRPTYAASPQATSNYPARSPPPYSAIGVSQGGIPHGAPSPEQSVDPRFAYMRDGGPQGYAAPSTSDPRQPQRTVSQPVANADRQGETLKRKHPSEIDTSSANPLPASAQPRPESSDGRAEKRLKQDNVAQTPVSASGDVKVNGVVTSTSGARLLCIADIRGDFKTLNTLIKQYNATAVIHTGEFGFLEARSPTRIKPTVLRHIISYSPLISDEARLKYLNLQHGHELFFALHPPSTPATSFKLSQIPALISGEIELAVPVYTLYSGMDDRSVVESFKSGEYQAKNLKILDHGSSKVVPCGEMTVRLFGIDLDIHATEPYDQVHGSGGAVGKQDKAWTTALQIGTLVSTAEKYFDAREIRIMMMNGPLVHDALATQMAVAIKADYVISGGTHLGVIRSFNEYNVQIDLSVYRTQIEKTRATFSAVFEAAKNQFADLSPDQQIKIRNAFVVLSKTPDAGAANVSVEAYDEFQAWQTIWNYDLCQATYGFLVLGIKGWRITPTIHTAGESPEFFFAIHADVGLVAGQGFEYRRHLPPPERPQARVLSSAEPIPPLPDQAYEQDRAVADAAANAALQQEQAERQRRQQLEEAEQQRRRQQEQAEEERRMQQEQAELQRRREDDLLRQQEDRRRQEERQRAQERVRLQDREREMAQRQRQQERDYREREDLARRQPPVRQEQHNYRQPEPPSRNMSMSSDGSQARADRRAVSFEAPADPRSVRPSAGSVAITPTDQRAAAHPQDSQRPAQIAIPPSQYNVPARQSSQATPTEYPFPVKPQSASPVQYTPRDPPSASSTPYFAGQPQQYDAFLSTVSSMPAITVQAARPASSNQLSMYAPLERQIAQDPAQSDWLRGDVYGTFGTTVEQIAMQQAISASAMEQVAMQQGLATPVAAREPEPPRAAWLHQQPTQRQAYNQGIAASRSPPGRNIPTYESRYTADERNQQGAPTARTQAVPPSPQRQTTAASTSRPAQKPQTQRSPQPQETRTQPQSAASGTAQKQVQSNAQKPPQAPTGQSQRQTQVQQQSQQRATQSSQTNTQPPNQTSTKPQATSSQSPAQTQVNGKLNASTAPSTAKAPTSANASQRPAATTSNSQPPTRPLPDTALQPAAAVPLNAASSRPESNVNPSRNGTPTRSPPTGPKNGPSTSATASRPMWTADEPARPRSPPRPAASSNNNEQNRPTLSERLKSGGPPPARSSDSAPGPSSSSVPSRPPSPMHPRSDTSAPALAARLAPAPAPTGPPPPDLRRLWIRGLPRPCTNADLVTIWSQRIQDRITSVNIPRATRGDHKGIAYVSFETERDAEDALRDHADTLHGSHIKLEISNPPNKPDRYHPAPAYDYRDDPDRSYRPRSRSPEYRSQPTRGRGRGRGNSNRR